MANTVNTGSTTISAITGGYSNAVSNVGVANSYAFSNSNISSGLHVSGDCTVDGNLKVKGKDIVKLFEKIEDRLAILQDPDPAKLEKFVALRKAYDHYKLLEKLINEN